MNILRTGNWIIGLRQRLRVVALAAVGLALVAPRGFSAQDSDVAPDVSIDRWLVSHPIALDSIEGSGEATLLSGSGEFGVLPRRGEEVAGTRWTLIRNGGAESSIRLDSIVQYIVEPGAERAFMAARNSVDAPYVVFAHAYIRSPEDRNVVFQWSSRSCSSTAIRLNGSRIDGQAFLKAHGPSSSGQGLRAEVRLAAGWNTLLVRIQVREAACGWLNVRLRPVPEVESTVDGIRVQGSRPHGQVRTGPEPWLVFGRWLRPSLAWRGNHLNINLPIPLTLWSRAVLDSVRLRIRAPDTDQKMTQSDLHVGRPDTIMARIPFNALTKLVKRPSIRVEAQWKDQKLEETLSVDSLVLERFVVSELKLEGWVIEALGAQDAGAPQLAPTPPAESGAQVRGRWIVPEELRGKTLELYAGGSPAEYLINGADLGDDRSLCTVCEAGSVIEISATTTAAWTGFPSVVVE